MEETVAQILRISQAIRGRASHAIPFSSNVWGMDVTSFYSKTGGVNFDECFI